MLKKIERMLRSKVFGYILLTSIFLLGFAARLYKINNPVADWHSWRQADTASVTRTYIRDGINLLLPRYHDISSIQSRIYNPNGYRMVEFPVYNAIGAVLSVRFTFLSMEVWSRILTIVSALSTAFFLYLVGKKYLGFVGGILSAFFYLFIPFNIYFTRVILPDPMGVMFGVIGLWLFSKYIDSEKLALLLASAVFFDLAFLIKPYLLFYLFPVGYLAVQKYGFKNLFKNKKIFIRFLAFFAVSFTPFFVWRWWEGRFPEGIPLFIWVFNEDGIRFKPAFWYWIFGERLGHLILGSLGLIPFVFGVLNTKKNNRFLSWFLIGVLTYLILVATANVKHDYYQIPVIPVIALTLASGIVYLFNQEVFNKILVRTIVAFCIPIMLFTGWYQIKGNYAINHPEIIEAGREVDKITPKDALVVAPYNGDTAFLYQTNRWGWPVIDNSIDNIIDDTRMIEARFKTIEKTDKFIIIDLHKSI